MLLLKYKKNTKCLFVSNNNCQYLRTTEEVEEKKLEVVLNLLFKL